MPDPRFPPGRLRIIAGHLRGSRLQIPAAPGLRPTPERVRETLFNWLAPLIEGARCLDLFAGTGALGIEALSRGAAHCLFVERDPALARALTQNLARLKVGNGEVLCTDAADWLSRPDGEAFDIAFVDPPFADQRWDTTLARLESAGRLKPAAWIHVEAPATQAFAVPPSWQLHREGRAGAVRHALYRR
ncbi:16S rRNA (guanine(966)-N(2))-methyltransferase RsmD [Dokdonella koreensis]|uniref:Ribosomal RNA small subunit methyltransferase D n=1 Tax=Dokdonella koreensis DS-123 TaxID=1300342 RepID=A0A160DUA9_9GAMM|nr:16S rRNA (guanine(966)-N(2))-methyltransferase RsmD [Dokdonella koreensis]ANB17824.1 16S rRNA (guanine(966)-N(2))-methyltransferase [Dokdonella koreensis DS-123]